MIKALAILKSIANFAWCRTKDAVVISLLILVTFLNWRLRNEKRRAEQSQLAAVAMPAGIKQIVTVYHDRVITKWREGPERIIYKEQYLPPEGTVTLVTKEDTHAASEVVVKDHGWTLRPGGGVLWSERLLPCADVKFAYWRRYGLTAGLTSDFGSLGATRHMDDLLPFHNLEFQGNLGFSWRGSLRLGLGIRTNF